MKTEMIPYGRQTITAEDIDEVIKVLNSPYLTQGPKIPEFEKAIADKVNAKHGVAVNSATSALHIACLALGLTKGDYLWTSPITFVASANCGRYCGAKIDFIDIDLETGLISIKELRRKLEKAEKYGLLPKIVVPVHLCGTSCDMSEIAKLSKRYGFHIIEDASHAIGGRYNSKPVGCCEYSDITVFSFHPVKIITTGEGGIATTQNPELAKRMKEFSSHGITKDTSRFIEEAAGPWSYEQQVLGFNYRMTDIQAALGLSQLRRLDGIVNERNRLRNRYQELLTHDNIVLLEIPKNTKSAVHLAVVRFKNITNEKHRFIFEQLRNNGIGVQIHYTPVHLQPYYRKRGFKIGDYRKAEIYARSVLSLPLFPGLRDIEQIRIQSSILKSYDE